MQTRTRAYRVRAHEMDTLTETIGDDYYLTYQAATEHAHWQASAYYGSKKATWFTMESPGRYLVGRVSPQRTREPVTCVITVEEYPVEHNDEDLW